MVNAMILLEGVINHDRLSYPDYVRVDGWTVKDKIFDYLGKIPEGAYVKVEIEVLDDRPNSD